MLLSPRDKLLQHSEGVLKWLREPEGALFSEYLVDLRAREVKKLKESESQVEVFRAQGSVGIIDVLLRVEEDLKQYKKDIAEGKAFPIKDTPKEVSRGLAGFNKR